MRKKLKLYVWKNFQPDYTPGLAFAIAENLVEAVALVRAKFEGELGFPIELKDFGPFEEFELTEKIAFARHGGA